MNRTRARQRLLLILTIFSLVKSASAGDWPYWVGPHFTGVSGARNLPEKWDPKGENVLWSAPIGSRSTPTLMNGRIYLLTNSFTDDIKKAGERLVCLDAKTGKQLWDYSFNVYLSDVPIDRVGWSSPVCDPETGNVYAQGVCGYFCCVNGETGKLIWDKSLHELYGFLTTYGGRTNYPIIHEDNVLISAVVVGWGDQARPQHRFLAMNKLNGQPVWFEGTRPLPYDTTYSAPVLGSVGGELQMVFGSGDGGIHGFQPRTGKKLWDYFLSAHGINTTPLIVGNRIYTGHAEENLDSTEMGAVVCLDATKRGDITQTGVIWKKTGHALGRSAPLLIDGRLYFANDSAKLICLNAETGEPIGEPVQLGTMMRANLLYADGKIYAHEVNSRGAVLQPTPEGAKVLHRFRFPRGEEAHGSPIAVDGRMYVPTSGHLYCVGKADHDEPDSPLPALPAEAPAQKDAPPAHVQLVPSENLFRPGIRQDLQTRLYSAQGQYLRTASSADVKFSVDGPGTIEEGRYLLPQDAPGHVPSYITAQVGELTGKARCRIVPDLNWEFDFNDGKVPVTWVSTAYRHVPLDFDLLTKLRNADPFTAGVYIYLMTEFANVGPVREFDDSTPQLRLKNMLNYLGIAEGPERPKTVEEARARFEKALQTLVDEKVVATSDWSTWDRPTGNGDEKVPEPRLKVTKGSRKIDGNGVLCKITTIPVGTRSQGWMGQTDLHDYTVQTDLLTYSRFNKLPDAGLIAQRYTFNLMGASQQLQIRTWTPQLDRFSSHASFNWKPDVWYTIKFRAEAQGDKAILKAKVWERGTAEPAEWGVVAEDDAPNLVGSPGLSGQCDAGELFYDNLKVYRNTDEAAQ